MFFYDIDGNRTRHLALRAIGPPAEPPTHLLFSHSLCLFVEFDFPGKSSGRVFVMIRRHKISSNRVNVARLEQ